MADVQDANSAPEPSMEEILASIRKIISDEKDAEPPPQDQQPVTGDVLELTQMVQDDGSVVDVSATPPAEEPAPTLASEPALEPAPPPPPPPKLKAGPEKLDGDEALVSDNTADSATTSLSALARTVETEHMAALGAAFTPLGNGARSLEEIVMELLRPMIKEWLDQNLPNVVEKLVQKEIERIASRLKE